MIFVLLAILAALTPAGALAQIRLGSEFQVTVYTHGNHEPPAVAVAPAGEFVVTWAIDQDGSSPSPGVFARRFSGTGNALGGEFQVNTHTTDSQRAPAVAMSASGDFVVAWQSNLQDGWGYGIFARRFSSDGVGLASEFRVNLYIDYSQGLPTVATGPSGNFVIAWQSYDGDGSGVFARRFSSSGVAVGTEFLVNGLLGGDQTYPAIAAVPSGDFLVVWTSGGQLVFDSVFARRLSSAGTPVAGEFQVNTRTLNEQWGPSVAGGSSGEFLVAWQEFDVFARRVSTSGTLLGSELLVNTFTSVTNERDSSVAAGAVGEFIVTWSAYGPDGSLDGVFARRFSSAGAALASEFQVNTYTPGRQEHSAVAASTSGPFVVAWRSANQDGSGYGVFAQRFAPEKILDIDGNGSVAPLTDGVLVLRFLFGFTGTTLTGGAVGNSCTRCDAAAIEPYLQTLI